MNNCNHGVCRFPHEKILLEEMITVAAACIINVLIVIFVPHGRAWDYFVLNLLIIAIIVCVAAVHNRMNRGCAQIARDWYVPAFLLVIYLESRRLVPLVNPHDLDELFFRIDRIIFLGLDPASLMEKIMIPALSEVLQISYASFYLLPFIVCMIIYLKRTSLEFHISASTILLGFYLSYIGYYITPVIGPRFMPDNAHAVPLQGLFLFDDIRGFLDHVEGLMYDCCPSGHAVVSLLSVMLAARYTRGFFPAACVWCFLIIFSTIYLQYHYVFDIIVGIALSLNIFHFWPGIAERYILKGGSTYASRCMPSSGDEESGFRRSGK